MSQSFGTALAHLDNGSDGVQHNGPLLQLLEAALPAWQAWLEPGGAIIFSWDATRFPREQMIAHAESCCTLRAHQGGPYDAMAHAVDRVIRKRDVVVMGYGRT